MQLWDSEGILLFGSSARRLNQNYTHFHIHMFVGFFGREGGGEQVFARHSCGTCFSILFCVLCVSFLHAKYHLNVSKNFCVTAQNRIIEYCFVIEPSSNQWWIVKANEVSFMRYLSVVLITVLLFMLIYCSFQLFLLHEDLWYENYSFVFIQFSQLELRKLSTIDTDCELLI